MKAAERRRGSDSKERNRAARTDPRDHKLQVKNGGRNLKPKEIDAKPTSTDKPRTNALASDLKTGVDPSKIHENMAKDHSGDAYSPDDNENHKNTSSAMVITGESDPEDNNYSTSSQGDSQASDEEKTENQAKVPKKGISNSTRKNSTDNLKNMKVHPKPLSDSSEGADSQTIEGINTPEDASSDGIVHSEEINDQDQVALVRKIEEMEARIEDLESELTEVAALEIALYSVVPEHGSSAHKVHTPARRLSRIYVYACKHTPREKRATVARNIVSGLVLVSKSCSNDVSRLTFWLSNTVVLREIISQAFETSCQSNEVETKTSSLKWKNHDWQETRTFASALEKVESWIFSRIVESIWWQTLTPNMQLPVNSSTKTGTKKLSGPSLCDQEQGNLSISLWKNAFHDSLKRLCPVRAGGHECGCLPVLARKVMGQCVGRLDVAMFNAILRESVHEIPTDPVSDPILDSKVLPIPAGDLSFGSGARLKNAVGNWERWLSDFLGMDTDTFAEDENNNYDSKEPKIFPLLNALSDLLMLPKDMLVDNTIRMEVCPSISLPLLKRILCNFSPDEFFPEPVPGSVLEALNVEWISLSGESLSDNSFPHTAPPVVYALPSPWEIAEKVAEAGVGGVEHSHFSRSASTVQRKGYTSDEELDELESCLTSVVDITPPSSLSSKNGGNGNARYDLLRQVWKA
ncbi:uncharacterized protein LOC127256714 [Andrographis paniculata]|uniref:uncharacterized protein LOC127256714 n=1 Tax=Andrographis paniculata TaxID=175694 RepID=UPI0021E8459F|nr:uncharacterized protein LOC127256714 [Andrographis paniculata]XP_051138819.1 uncharacterized protein LOC127256714 [Andrographis paniculata]XP_051138820.1 uncharacterized protein LOC127256714 [Andrographis paniculata]